MSARRQLINIQKGLTKRIKAEIAESLGAQSHSLVEYQREYHRELKGFDRIATKDELIEKVIGADIVYVGDYHTLIQSQKTVLKILKEVLKRRQEIILLMEVARSCYQDVLDKFMKGKIREKTFLKKIDYENSWGFNWQGYKEILEFARANKIKVFATNTASQGLKHHILKRDLMTAEIIANTILLYPDHLIYVVNGDWHIAEEHLPRLVNQLLRFVREKRKSVIIYQNSERIYWSLAKIGQEQTTDVVHIKGHARGIDEYCVMNTTPLVKYQSYLNWLWNLDELFHPIHPEWADIDGENPDYSEQIYEFVQIITNFLGIKNIDKGSFTVYTSHNLDFLKVLKEKEKFSRNEIREISTQILKNESYFITKGNIIYLSNLSLNHAAEEAAHFVNTQCSGCRLKPASKKEDFYFRVMREALGFFGSKIINHKRLCYHKKDFINLLKKSRHKKLEGRDKELKTIAEFVIQHKEMEEDYIKKRKKTKRKRKPFKNRLNKIYRQRVNIHLGITHALGYILGDKLHYAVTKEKMKRKQIKELFCNPFDEEGSAFSAYMELTLRLRQMGVRVKSKGEKF